MINKALILGRIGKKEVKTLKSGGQVTALYIATSKKWIDKSGQHQEETTWHNVNCFNKLAEIAEKYAEVGNLLWVMGEIHNKKQKTDNGEFKYYYSVTADEIKLLPRGKKKEDEQSSALQNVADSFDDDLIPF